MKALFIGGTGTISLAITKRIAQNPDWELCLLNRGNRTEEVPEPVHLIEADIQDEASVAEKLADMHFDVVADFIAFVPEHIERDIRLFAGKVKQYFFISSASAYQKPLSDFRITESTPLCNPYWQYSRDKIACEERLIREYRDHGFPVTIVSQPYLWGYLRPGRPPRGGGKLASYSANDGRQACDCSRRRKFSLDLDPQQRFCQRVCGIDGKSPRYWGSSTDYLRGIAYLESNLSNNWGSVGGYP